MSLSSLLNAVGRLERYQLVQDTSGGAKRQAWVVVPGYEEVLCSVQPASGNVQYKYAQRNIVVSHTIYTDVPLPITGQLRFRSDDTVYTIHGYGDAAGRGICYTLDVEKTLP